MLLSWDYQFILWHLLSLVVYLFVCVETPLSCDCLIIRFLLCSFVSAVYYVVSDNRFETCYSFSIYIICIPLRSFEVNEVV